MVTRRQKARLQTSKPASQIQNHDMAASTSHTLSSFQARNFNSEITKVNDRMLMK